MTAFPDWPAWFRVCIVCGGQVSTQDHMDTDDRKRGEFFTYSRHGDCEKLSWQEEQENSRALDKHRSAIRLSRERRGIADNEYFTRIAEPSSICYRRQGLTLP